METKDKTVISVYTEINAPIDKVWKLWTTPEDIVNWNNASDDWHTPHAENNLQEGSIFKYRMEAKDGSMGFDFWGVYDKVIINKQIEATLGDGRELNIYFTTDGNSTKIVESFEAETTNTVELQRSGWQSILGNFKRYAEGK